MSDELLDGLTGACGVGFEDVTQRYTVLSRARESEPSEARAFYIAALEHREVPNYVKAEIAVEVEWWRFTDLVCVLTALVGDVPTLSLYIDALTALADGGRCVCDVYAQRRATSPSPLMEKVRDLAPGHPQTDESEYRCRVCGATLVHRSEHHERGATFHSWRRAGPTDSG